MVSLVPKHHSVPNARYEYSPAMNNNGSGGQNMLDGGRDPGMTQSHPSYAAVVAVSTTGTQGANQGGSVTLDPAFCPIHCPAENQDPSIGWAERENGVLLPNVNLSLSLLGPNIKTLLKSHGGALPL